MVSFCEVTESVEFETSQSVAELNAEANTTTLQLKPEQAEPSPAESSTPKRRRTSTIQQQEASFRGHLQLVELSSSQYV